MDGIRRLFIAVAFLFLVAEPSAALNIVFSLDVQGPEISLGLDRYALELDREVWTLLTIDDAIANSKPERPVATSDSDGGDGGDWEVSLTRVWE